MSNQVASIGNMRMMNDYEYPSGPTGTTSAIVNNSNGLIGNAGNFAANQPQNNSIS
jgi:hypothetical protein